MKNPDKYLKAQRWTVFVYLALIVATLAGSRVSPVAAALARGERVPVLAFGVDAADQSRHTDTLMLGVYDPIKDFLNVLSVPRDTRINLPGYTFRRINEIYGYTLRKTGDPHASSLKIIEGIDYLLSSDNFHASIPHYVQVDFDGFRRLIDAMGGIWVVVKQPMHYDDNAGHYHFHREPGRYLLGGQEALFYVRFRGPTGDRGRIFRQQEFVRTVLKRLANPMMVFRFPEMFGALTHMVRTNLSFWDFLFLANEARRLRSDNIGFYILPGQSSNVYWAPKKEMLEPLAQMLFSGKQSALDFSTTIAPQANRITIKVWNASGKSGYAYVVTKFLRSKDHDVLDWGNYAQQQLQTRVIDRTGTIENAQLVARDLGVDNYHSEPNPKALVDVEVVIGQNYHIPQTGESLGH